MHYNKAKIVMLTLVKENFFCRLKIEMFYSAKFDSVNAFIDELKIYIDYCNNEQISMKLKK